MLSLSLLHQVELDTIVLQESDDRLLSFTNHENVGESGSEGVTSGVLDVSNIEASGVSLDVLELSHSANVVSCDRDNLGSIVGLDHSVDLTGLQIKLKRLGTIYNNKN